MKHKKRPPKIAELLLKLFSPDNFHTTAPGDFEEVYFQLLQSDGFFRAWIWYWRQVLRSLPGLINEKIYGDLTMIRNYLKVAFRNIKRHKGYSFINISGLAVSMACCMIIIIFVQNDLTYDSFHSKADRIFRLQSNLVVQPGPLAPYLKENFPEVENAVRLARRTRTIRYEEKVFEENRLYSVDPNFFDMFDFPLIKGNPETALNRPYTVVVTEETAVRYFGTEDALGKTLRYDDTCDLTVTGVMKDIPDNSNITFDLLLSNLTDKALGSSPDDVQWGNHFLFTYVELADQVDYLSFIPQIENIVIEQVPALNISKKLTMVPLRHIHLYENNAIRYVYIFSAIAVFILLIACINFINLTTARVNTRIREIGVRKVIGGTRSMLAKQFFGESVLTTMIAGMLAIFVLLLALPFANSIANLNFTPAALINNPIVISGFFILICATGILAGLYPAIYISAFRPAFLIKGTGAKHRTNVLRRKILVVFQFVISVALIISTGIIYSQLEYIQSTNLGYEKEHLLFVRLKTPIRQNSKVFKEELLRNPEISSVCLASSIPSYVGNTGSGMDWDEKPEDLSPSWPFVAADPDYISTIGLELSEGRDFSKDLQTDGELSFIVNEKAVEAMGYESPIGKRFSLWGNEGKIIGVLRDFHFRPLHKQIEPLMIFNAPNFYSNAIIRIRPETSLSNTIEYIENVWNQFARDFPVEVEFLDQSFQQYYESEKRMSEVFRYFTFITIFIACLGLFGLISCIVEQRTKEIGIRKTLGAGLSNIVGLIGKEFLLLIVVSNIIAWPIAYFAMEKWLSNFAYHTDIALLIFVVSFIVVVALTIATIGIQILRAARANPVDSLRYE
ncbi:ABC transporter permease [candidate division KSB1 bacterium]